MPCLALSHLYVNELRLRWPYTLTSYVPSWNYYDKGGILRPKQSLHIWSLALRENSDKFILIPNWLVHYLKLVITFSK